MSLLSCYILTFNSQKYLNEVLEPISQITDDIVLLDSGSSDNTKDIGKKFNARFIHRKFDDFKTQRNYAASQCLHNYVMFVVA